MTEEQTRIAFVCVQNAGRSQMATAFANREIDQRDMTDSIMLMTGGTDPAGSVHDIVIEIMDEIDIDLSGNVPREITESELQSCDYVVTMGCSTWEFNPASGPEVIDWALPDPDGVEKSTAREIRDLIEENVVALFDELT